MSELQVDSLALRLEQNKTRTNMRNQEACVSALANWATARWPCGMAELMFSSALKKKLAMSAARIDTVADLARELSPNCALETNLLDEHTDELVSIIKSIILSTQQDIDDGDIDIHDTFETQQSHYLKEHLERDEATQS